jgi:hypothetical protein
VLVLDQRAIGMKQVGLIVPGTGALEWMDSRRRQDVSWPALQIRRNRARSKGEPAAVSTHRGQEVSSRTLRAGRAWRSSSPGTRGASPCPKTAPALPRMHQLPEREPVLLLPCSPVTPTSSPMDSRIRSSPISCDFFASPWSRTRLDWHRGCRCMRPLIMNGIGAQRSATWSAAH